MTPRHDTLNQNNTLDQAVTSAPPHSEVQATVPGRDWHHLVYETAATVRKIALAVANRLPHHLRDEIPSVARYAATEAASKFTGSIPEFRAYLRSRIRGAIVDHLRKSDVLERRTRKIQRQIEALRQQMPGISDEEIAERLNISREKIEYVNLMAEYTSCSLDNPQEHWSDRLAYKGWSPERILLEKERRGLVSFAMVNLTQQERRAFELHYEQDLLMKDVAEKMSLSKPRVTQLIQQARAKVEAWMRKNTY